MDILATQVADYMQNASWIRRMFELGAQLKAKYGPENVQDFSLGNPDLPAPAAVKKALEKIAESAGEKFAFGYMSNGGFPELRAKLAQYLSKEQNMPLTGDDVILGCGAAGTLNAFFRAILNPGDEVLTFAPYFVEYGFYCENHGARLKAVPSLPETFAPDLAALEKAVNKNTAVVLINSPHNPTGVVYKQEVLQELANLLENRSQQFGRPIWLAADEPYRFLVYDGKMAPPILPLYPYAVVIGSLSKNMSLPGERIGYLAVSPRMPEKKQLMDAMSLTTRILGFVNPPVIGQRILDEALGSNVDLNIYDSRRKAMAEVLSDAGYNFIMPEGAFYFFPQAPGGDDVAFVNLLLEENILAVPGSGFGWPGHFRLAFCVDESVIRAAGPGFARAFKKATQKDAGSPGQD